MFGMIVYLSKLTAGHQIQKIACICDHVSYKISMEFLGYVVYLLDLLYSNSVEYLLLFHIVFFKS